MAGAFGKGSQRTGNNGTSAGGTGTEGSKEGKSSTGAKTGTGGYGTFDLGGRSLGTGSLPKPAYNVQEEGDVYKRQEELSRLRTAISLRA